MKILRIVPQDWRSYSQNMRISQIWRPNIEDGLANFEDFTLIFKEIEDSFMSREPLSRAWGKVQQKTGKCAMRYTIKNKVLCDRVCNGMYHRLPITAWESCFFPKFSSKVSTKNVTCFRNLEHLTRVPTRNDQYLLGEQR